MSVSSFYDVKWASETFTNTGRFEQTAVQIPPDIAAKGRGLDCGAGVGRFARFLVDRGRFQRSQITCCDVSPMAVGACKEAGFSAFEFDIEKGAVPEPFDLIFFLECMEHVYQPARVLEHLRDSLAPGGWLVLSTPNFVYLYWRLRCGFGVGHEPPGNGHISLFTPRLLGAFLKRSGLQVERRHFITRLETFRLPGRVAAALTGRRQPNGYTYIRTPFWPSLLSEIMIFVCRRVDP